MPHTPPPHRLQPWLLLGVLALAACLLCQGLAVLSVAFAGDTELVDRPIVLALTMFGLLFVIYLAAQAMVLRLPAGKAATLAVVVPAIGMRLLLVGSEPIQEVDIYRYLWDGAVYAAGHDPYAVPPQRVRTAFGEDPAVAHLERLAELQPALWAVLERVHFDHLPTPYPPVSQWLFGAGACLTPAEADLPRRRTTLIWLLVGFDLATLAVVLWLLVHTGRHPGWALAYGWCPLVLKEVANSGHLDALAVFFATASIGLLVLAAGRGGRARVWTAGLAGTSLALGIGAKLYPVVLLPLFGLVGLRRLGGRATLAGVIATVAVGGLSLWPMLRPRPPLPPVPADAVPLEDEAPAVQRPTAGIVAFLRRWEMNDLLFMVVYENLEPDRRPPWFVVTPDRWRRALAEPLGRRLGLRGPEAVFHLTRLLTGLAVLVLAVVLGWRAGGAAAAPEAIPRAAFLTLAWFWMLSPTQNPWYWTWALPLVAFARCRSWLLVGGLALGYYLRFWFDYHMDDTAVLGTPYVGKHFFDYIGVWLELGPVLLALMAESVWRWRAGPQP